MAHPAAVVPIEPPPPHRKATVVPCIPLPVPRPSPGHRGAVLSLLAGAVAAGSPAQASAAGTFVVSGLLRTADVDAATPAPVGEAYRVRAVDAAGAVVEEIVTDETYSLTLPGAGAMPCARR